MQSRKIKDKIRKRLAREKNLLNAGPTTGLSVALVYPNSYAVGMGNLGFQKIYKTINSLENAYCHRSFLPSMEEQEWLKKKNIPYFSFETGDPLSKYHIVAFSITYEMDYLNVLKVLKLAHIPIFARDRNLRDPFILMGGVCPSLNPEPLAPFADAFCVGEGEELVPELLEIFDRTIPREELLKTIAGISGIYVPSGYEVKYDDTGAVASIKADTGFPRKVERRWVKDLGCFPTASVIRAPDAVFGDMRLVEINRGCGRHCRFCVAGYIYRPPRFYPFDIIRKEIDKGLEMGMKIGLLGSACCDHPRILEIARYIVEKRGKFSLSSLRLERIPKGLTELLAECGQRSLAVAPEAATERLRSVINKPLDDETLIISVRGIFTAGIKNLKLYLLIGLPTEKDEDIEAVSLLARDLCRIRDECRTSGRQGTITLSVNPFIPKPSTPFQWTGMEEVSSLRRKIKRIKEGVKGLSGVKLTFENPRVSFLQALLSRGDRRVGDFLPGALDNEKDWPPAPGPGFPGVDFYALRTVPLKETLPWNLLDTGVKKDYLSREFTNTTLGVETPACPDTDCYRCGDFQGM